MTTVVDTSILIDVLRGVTTARSALREARRAGQLHASEVTRLDAPLFTLNIRHFPMFSGLSAPY